MRRRYYCVKQHDITDCAAATLATICLQYGKEVSIARIREMAGTDRFGTTAYGRLVKNFVFPIYNVSCKVGLCY